MKAYLYLAAKAMILLLFMPVITDNGTVNAQIPHIAYSTFLGGSQYDDGQEISVDDSGHAYVKGNTVSTNFPRTTGCFYATPTNVFLTKMSLDGSKLNYSTFLAGSSFYVQKSGNIYYMNSVQSHDFPPTPNPDNCKSFFYKIDTAGNKHLFLSHWSHQGRFVVDDYGYVIISGTVSSADFIATKNAYDTSYNGGDDIFIAKLDIEKDSVLFSTLIGGTGNESGSITLDSQNNIIVSGTTNSENFPIKGSSFANYTAGSTYAFVTKLKTDGSDLMFSTLLGNGFGIWGLATDLLDNIYLSGTVSSGILPTTPSVYDASFNGGSDAYLIKLTADGSQMIYSTYIGGTGNESGRSIVVDKNRKVYFTGCTMSSNFPVTSNAAYPNYGGCSGCPSYGWGDAFLLIMNADGSQVEYATYLGGPYDEEAYGIGMDKYGDVYLTGVSSSSTFPTTANAYSRTPYGHGDVYITKFAVGSLVGIETNTGVPSGADLQQNLPNPFNTITTINYSLEKPTHVKLTIYDLQGKAIGILVNAYKTNGKHSVSWDATEDNNQSVKSGIYFYSLETDNFSIHKKMILAR